MTTESVNTVDADILDEEPFDEEEYDELLDGDDNTEDELPEDSVQELTLEGLAQGVQGALNSITEGVSREFDRLNSEIDKLKKDMGKMEGYQEGKLEGFDKRISNTKDRLLKAENSIKRLASRMKKVSK